MLVKSTVAVALFASAVAAQTGVTNITIDPTQITPLIRSQWCSGQQNTCGTLCSGNPSINSCNTTTLAFNCTCAANNSAPGLQYYTTTMPTFECLQVFNICNAQNVGDASAQALCLTNKNNDCGTLDPTTFVATTSSSSSAIASPTGSSSSASTAPTSSSSKAAAATMAVLPVLQHYGSGAMAVGFAAAFGFML